MAVVAKRFTRPVEGAGVRDHIRENLRQRQAVEENRFRSLREYAELVPEPKGALNFEQFPFQLEPFYSDEIANAREVVYMKSTQIGASTAMWRWAVRFADQFGETVIYFFPTDAHVREFAIMRIEPGIRASSYLTSRIPAHYVRQQGLKQIGTGWVSLRGVKSKVAVQSVDAEAVVFDEYDESDPDNIAQAEQRLSGAIAAGRQPKLRRLGRPSVPGYGIDAAYQDSDRRHWLVTCSACDLEQSLTFHENLRWTSSRSDGEPLRAGHDEYENPKDVVEAWRVCGGCGESLEPPQGERVGPIHAGRWEAQSPGPGRVPGFHIPRLIVPRTDLKEIVKDSRARSLAKIEVFHWAVLGEAYAPADARLTDAHLDSACSQGYAEPFGDIGQGGYRGRRPVTMGLDMASERDLSCRISEHGDDGIRRAIYLGEPRNMEEVTDLVERFRPAVIAVDSQPERHAARGLEAAFPGRVFLVRYDQNVEADAIKYDEKRNVYSVNRTEAIDSMMDSIRGGWNAPLQNPPAVYRGQMKAMVRKLEEDSRGRPVRRYVTTGNVGDDFAHAEVYDLVATEILGQLEYAHAHTDAEGPIDPEDLGVDVPSLDSGDVSYRPGFE